MKRWPYSPETRRDHITDGGTKRAGVVMSELSRGWEKPGRWWVCLMVAWGAVLWSWCVYFAPTVGGSQAIAFFRRASLPDPLGDLWRWLRNHATDAQLIAGLAILLSVCAYTWYDHAGLTVGYGDAVSRMVIARRVVVGRTTGLAQLGTTWLPLHTMLMLPFIWNDTLFHDGIAGALPSMVAYVLTAIYLYRLAYLLFAARGTAWIAALIFLFNPSVIYMQSTAMSEVPLLCAATIAIYYMIRWVRSYYVVDLVKCAAAVAVGAGIRYDGWALAAVLALVVVYVAWKRQGYMGAESHAIIYGMLAFSSCVAWVIYNGVIFHDPLLFLFFGNTSHTVVHLVSYHRPWLSFEMFSRAAGGTAGWVMTALAALGLIIFIFRFRLRASVLPVYALLIPFAYHWLIFYMGIDSIFMPQLGLGEYWNVRFGLMLMPAIVVFAAVLAHQHQLLRIGMFGVVLVFLVMNMTIETPMSLREPVSPGSAEWVTDQRAAAQWLLAQYTGGNVLISYNPDAPMAYFLMRGIPDQSFITDSAGAQFTAALTHPENSVRWIILDADTRNSSVDPIYKSLQNRQDWQRFFVLRQVFGTAAIGTIAIYEYVSNMSAQTLPKNGVSQKQGIQQAHALINGPPIIGALKWPR